MLSKHANDYRAMLENADLPGLDILTDTTPPYPADCEIAFREPNLICEALPYLPNLKWAQSTWAGVEPLLAPSLRRDYTLTTARGVFGGVM